MTSSSGCKVRWYKVCIQGLQTLEKSASFKNPDFEPAQMAKLWTMVVNLTHKINLIIFFNFQKFQLDLTVFQETKGWKRKLKPES